MIHSRSGSQGSSSAPPQSIEAVRRRARHRLIGASVLVAIGVIGFPLLFDSQPRPIAVDIPIEIPARPVSAPLPKPAPAAASTVAPAPAAAPTAAAPTPSPEPAPAPAPAAAPSAAPVQAQSPVPQPAPAKAPEPDRTAATEAARAQALLQGQPAPAASTAAATERVVVQVGAFADEARARETRQKLERAGFKTYTHVAQTAEGRRIRVRVGPYESRAEAEKVATRVKALGLPAAILTL